MIARDRRHTTAIMVRQRVVQATAQITGGAIGTDMGFLDPLEITNTLIIFVLLYRWFQPDLS
jgi:hypothetical protein